MKEWINIGISKWNINFVGEILHWTGQQQKILCIKLVRLYSFWAADSEFVIVTIRPTQKRQSGNTDRRKRMQDSESKINKDCLV